MDANSSYCLKKCNMTNINCKCCFKQSFCHSYFVIYFAAGLSPDLQSMEQIRRIMRPTDVPDQGIVIISLINCKMKVHVIKNIPSLLQYYCELFFISRLAL